MDIMFDIATKQLSVEGDPSPYGGSFRAGIRRYGSEVKFSALSGGVTVRVNGDAVKSVTWPAPGVRFSKTNEDVLVTFGCGWAPEQAVEITAWFENAGVRYETARSFTSPRPPKPYESWTWVGGDWQPPVPYPSDGEAYDWDEAAGGWVPLT